ncbi:MAG: hypothetical protein ACYS32_09280 [Planctomycetota bacterium]|jgi:hypothetical protein
MKRYLILLILLCVVSTTQGAHFTYYAGGFRAFCDVYAQDSASTHDPLSQTDNSTTAASVTGSAAVLQARSYARNDINRKISGNSIRIILYSVSDGAADNSLSYISGWGYGITQDSLTYGIFYKIMPDANEQYGDDVIVYYNDNTFVSASGVTHLILGGPGTMDHIAITRGQLPPVTTEPVRENEVLSFPKVEFSNSGGNWFSGVHPFPAKIGDVIGVFAKNRTDIIGLGPLTGFIESTFTMILTVRTVLSGDLDYDDDVDFFDLAILANNWLVDISSEPVLDTTPPTPNPMQWADGGEPQETYGGGGPFDFYATMTAEIATDPSGGIQYYFECLDESGFDSSWQGNPSYTVPVGGSGQGLLFTVKARDILGNETNPSTPPLPAN